LAVDSEARYLSDEAANRSGRAGVGAGVRALGSWLSHGTDEFHIMNCFHEQEECWDDPEFEEPD
jgi:hypothetical protein